MRLLDEVEKNGKITKGTDNMEKVMTRCGLLLMSKEERENWLESIMTGNVISGDKVAELIDASKEKLNEVFR